MSYPWIFLAAGRGLRMGSLTTNRPKPLVSAIGKAPILQVNLINLCDAVVSPHVVIIGGHKHEALAAFISSPRLDRAEVRMTINDRFETAGPLYSVMAGVDGLDEDQTCCVVANGDTIFSAKVYEVVNGLIHDGLYLIVSEFDACEHDDVRVARDRGIIVAAEKNAERGDRDIISAGMLVIRGAAEMSLLRSALAISINREVHYGRQQAWHSVIAAMSDSGAVVQTIPLPHTWWKEFDDQDSLERWSSYFDHSLSHFENLAVDHLARAFQADSGPGIASSP